MRALVQERAHGNRHRRSGQNGRRHGAAAGARGRACHLLRPGRCRARVARRGAQRRLCRESGGALHAPERRAGNDSDAAGRRRGRGHAPRSAAAAFCRRHPGGWRQQLLPRLQAPRARTVPAGAALCRRRRFGRRARPRARLLPDARRHAEVDRDLRAVREAPVGRSRPGLAALRPERRRPLRQDDPQRHRVRHDAGARRGLRAHRRAARARHRPGAAGRDLAPRQRRAILAARSVRRHSQGKRGSLGHCAGGRRFRRRALDAVHKQP